MRRTRIVALVSLAIILTLLPCQRAFAETHEVSGSVSASTLAAGDSLELVGDTTLVMDQDLTLAYIHGADFALEVTGAGTLTVANEADSATGDITADTIANSAIYVSTLSSQTSLNVSSKAGNGIYAVAGPVSVTGDVVATAAEQAIHSGSRIDIEGTVNATSTTTSAIHNDKGGMSFKGDVTATGAAAIHANDIADATVTIEGDVNATGTKGNGPCCGIYARNAGEVIITGDVICSGIFPSGSGFGGLSGAHVPEGNLTINGNVHADGCLFGLYGKGVRVVGNVEASGWQDGGIWAYENGMYVDGDVNCKGGSDAICCLGGNIEITGDVEAFASTGGMSCHGISASRDLHIGGDVKATGTDAGICTWGMDSSTVTSWVFDGNVEAHGGSYGGLLALNGDVSIAGNLDVEAKGEGVRVKRNLDVTGDVDVTSMGNTPITANGNIHIGGNATAVTGENVGNFGIYAHDSLAIDGNTTAESCYYGGVFAYNGDMTLGGDVQVSSGFIGLQCGGNLQLLGKNVSVTIKPSGSSSPEQCSAIIAGGSIETVGQVVATGGGYGINVRQGDLNVRSGRVEATGSELAIRANGIVIASPLGVLEPKGGKVGSTTVGDVTVATFVTSSGTPVTHTIIDRVEPDIQLIPIYRMYNTKTSEHLWTKSKKEYDSCGKGSYVDWRQENVAWYSPNMKAPASYAASTQGDYVYVWRLYDKGRTGDHIYLTYGAEMKSYLENGWVVDKGAGFWTMKKGATISGRKTIPIYRAYNPKLKRGKHHYTPSKLEYDKICKNNGWKPEGVKFYVIKK